MIVAKKINKYKLSSALKEGHYYEAEALLDHEADAKFERVDIDSSITTTIHDFLWGYDNFLRNTESDKKYFEELLKIMTADNFKEYVLSLPIFNDKKYEKLTGEQLKKRLLLASTEQKLKQRTQRHKKKSMQYGPATMRQPLSKRIIL